MKLNQFIQSLQKISKIVRDPEHVGVTMADCIPVMNPILKDGVVYITDQDDSVVGG